MATEVIGFGQVNAVVEFCTNKTAECGIERG